MARTVQEKIDANDIAIAAIEGGAQSYTTADGRTVTKASLATLYDERDRLRTQLAMTRSNATGRARMTFKGAG